MVGLSQLLKRHPLPIVAHFEHLLVLTYAFPPAVLAPLLPPGLELDTYEGRAFLAIATVRTHGLRPSFFPKAFGRDFFLAGYRVFTRFRKSNGEVLRGLRIIRTDTDSASMVEWGNRFTRYGYRKAEVQCRREAVELHFNVETPGAEADLDFTANIRNRSSSLPPGSPFPDVECAEQFLAPLPYTFDYEEATNSMIVVLARRPSWVPQPIEVHVRKCTFIDSRAMLASAFYLENVPYRWDRGIREVLASR